MGFAPIISGGLALAQGITGAMGAGQAASAKANDQMVQAQIAMNNMAVAKQNAELETSMGEYKVAQTGLVGANRQGQIVGAQAKSGVDANTGSSSKVRQAAATSAVQDVGVARSDMARKVYGYQVQQQNFGNQASVDSATAKNTMAAAPLQEFSSLLGGAAGAASSFGKFNWGGGGGGSASA